VRKYKLDAPRGVNGRNSDNTLIQKYLGWEPSIRLKDGLARTYEWIEGQYLESQGSFSAASYSSVKEELTA